jgi:hypothetical protein
MSRFATLTLLVLRQLWISFRLLAILLLAVGSAVPVVLLPASPGTTGTALDALGLLALATAAALALVAAIAGMAVAAERRRGRAAWLVLRAVPRHTLLLAWFAALGAVLALGLLPAGVLAWLATGSDVVTAGPAAFATTLVAVYLAGLAALSIGLLLGVMLPAWAAGPLTLVLVGAGLLMAALGPAGWAPLPGAGIGILARLDEAARPIADSLRASGTALALTAALLVGAAAVLERVDL